MNDDELAAIEAEAKASIDWRDDQTYQSGHETDKDTIVALIAALRQSRAENERLRAAIEKHRDCHANLPMLPGDRELWASIEKERT